MVYIYNYGCWDVIESGSIALLANAIENAYISVWHDDCSVAQGLQISSSLGSREFCERLIAKRMACQLKVHSRSVDPQKNRCNYLITPSILKNNFQRRSSLRTAPFF